ncbi:MAG: REP element-mobilizing transposase RayT [Ilumatobacter sp.]|jgi:REP element-mobilizing transposase RayT
MPRSLRLDPIDAFHHITNRGVDRQAVFFSDADRVEFGRLLGEICEMFEVEVLAYCLMDNHFHLLLRCPNGGLSDAMQRLGSVYTRHVNDRVGRDGPLFRGRFHSRLIGDVRYLANVVRYIHRNALDIGGVQTVSGYRWSSHRTYLGHRRCPSWLATDHVMEWFEDDPAAFDAFVNAADGPPNRATRSFDLSELRAAVDLAVYQHAPDELGAMRSLPRVLCLLFAQQLPIESAQRLMAELGLGNAAAFKSAAWRANRHGNDPCVQHLVAAVHRLLATPVSVGV